MQPPELKCGTKVMELKFEIWHFWKKKIYFDELGPKFQKTVDDFIRR